MTEEEWLACTDPTPMLEYVSMWGKASDRKLRLFAAGCSRRLWEGFAQDQYGTALELSEQLTNGQASEKDRDQAWQAVPPPLGFCYYLSCAVVIAGHEEARLRESIAGSNQVNLARHVYPEESRRQSALIRDIFGNPFRPVLLDPAWLTPTVTDLATVAYNERALPSGELDTALLAVLADALEEVGCTDSDILGHMRSPGPHVRGCWAVDALTGRS
jgi:hypothetical protein